MEAEKFSGSKNKNIQTLEPIEYNCTGEKEEDTY
jgi:hypothetical protein